MFKLAVNGLWIGEYSGISAVPLKDHWFWRSGSLAEVSQKQRISFKVLMGTVTGWRWGKVYLSLVGFLVCIVVLVSITFLKDSLIFRENSPCEFNSKLGNQALIPLQRRKNLINSLKHKPSLIIHFIPPHQCFKLVWDNCVPMLFCWYSLQVFLSRICLHWFRGSISLLYL